MSHPKDTGNVMWGKQTCPEGRAGPRNGNAPSFEAVTLGFETVSTRSSLELNYSPRQLLNWGVGGEGIISESKLQQQRISETNSEKPSLAESITGLMTTACYDWPTRMAKLARAHCVIHGNCRGREASTNTAAGDSVAIFVIRNFSVPVT